MNYDFSIKTEFLILTHLAVNGVVFGICLHRLRLMRDVLMRVKIQYVVLLVASVANGFSPMFFKQWPTVISVAYACSVLLMLVSDMFQWKNGQPPEAAKTHAMSLEETTHAH